MALEAAKNSRRGFKAQVTKQIKALERFTAEERNEDVLCTIEQLRKAFQNFEDSHVAYQELVEDNNEEKSDDYLYEVQDEYVKALREAKKWVAQNSPKENNPTEPSPVKDDRGVTHSELMAALNLPRVELDTFNGDPMTFHSFMATFEEHVGSKQISDAMKLSRLLQYTSGRAKEAIQACALMGGSQGYRQALGTLHKRFGDSHIVAEKLIASLQEGRAIKGAEELRKLADQAWHCALVLQRLGRSQELDTQSNIKRVLQRLPRWTENRWRRQVQEQKKKTSRYPSFQDFVHFLEEEADFASDPVYGDSSVSTTSNKPAAQRGTAYADRKQSQNFNVGVKRVHSCVACERDHPLYLCPTFKNLQVSERLDMVNNKKLCEICLRPNHITTDCRQTYRCMMKNGAGSTCGGRHSSLIHVGKDASSVCSIDVNVASEKNKSQYCLPTVPVIVNDKVKVNVLLDSGSSGSFCTRSLVEKLGITEERCTCILSTITESSKPIETSLVSFHVTSLSGDNELHCKDVCVVRSIPAQVCKVNVQKYEHLAEVPLGNVGPSVDILLGQDHSEALIPLQARRGNYGEPFCVQTLLGWSLNGPVQSYPSKEKKIQSNFVHMDMEGKVKNMWEIENEELQCDPCLSQEDKRVLELWDNEVQVQEGHYTLPIPWKDGISFPNNLSMAESRLKSLRNSLDKKNLTSRYDEEIQKLISKGYAEKVPDDPGKISENVWYLPHQAVISESKPGKLRVVFDCAARYHGESLNMKALQGPDQNNKLLHVLLRFRNHEIAVMADVEAMYNQVRVPCKDRDSLRFLWIDENQEVQHYRMTSHLFGGVWCASAATYALRRTVQDHGDVSSLVASTVNTAFYVDDMLQSVSSKEEAEVVIRETKSLLQKKGFNLTKFVVSNEDVMESVPEADRAKEVKSIQTNGASKALGVRWNSRSDRLYFDLHVPDSDVATKRSMLSILSSMFDPLGMISPILVVGKIILQDVTRLKLDWDDPVPSEIASRWVDWLNTLDGVKSFNIPRCVKPSSFDGAHLELHHFSDASEKAYGVCSFLRCVNPDKDVHTSLVFSKGRVAPLKQLSIPRLELQAALLAAKCDDMIRASLELPLAQSTFWVDSEIVLKYIQNERLRLQIFEGNRVGEIRRTSEPHQWRHVPGVENPADLVSRGGTCEQLKSNDWFEGPEFLHCPESEWPKRSNDNKLSGDDPGVRSKNVGMVQIAPDAPNPIDVLAKYYSSWYKLKRAVAWLLRLKSVLRKQKTSKGGLTVDEINQAQIVIVKHAQQKAYSKEISRLTDGKPLNTSSPLIALCPILDVDGVLRVGGRLKHAPVLVGRHPILIPHTDCIAQVIVSDYHNIAHMGATWVTSLIRRHFWITKIGSIVKKMSRNCVTCKKCFASPCSQQMADLPPDRLEPHKPPFSVVGMDCFGPFYVKLGRSEVKRYCCIFTCFTTRAVHLEKLCSLDTDSFINCLRRFMARRGSPEKIYCDNGTNFVGAKNELAKSLRELVQAKITNECVKSGTEWNFNPPLASHMGGMWERLIRTSRKVFSGLFDRKYRMTDEILDTILCEAEAIINSRPLTKIVDDPNSDAILTPAHFLMLVQGHECPPGVFDEKDVFRKRWRFVQYLCNEFWRRWLLEYLPELQKRQKWFRPQRNLQVGDVVLLCDESVPRYKWPLGRILQVNVGLDGLVRSVRVKTRLSVFDRPIHKVVLIEGSVH